MLSVQEFVGAWRQDTFECLPMIHTVKNVCEFDHGPFEQFVHTLQNCKKWALPKKKKKERKK